MRTVCGTGERQRMRRGELGARREGEQAGGKAEGGRGKAGVSTHHAPGISYLKFSRSAPQKPLQAANKDAPGRTFEDALRGRTF